MEKLTLAHGQLAASAQASPHAEIAALRIAGVGEAAVEALKFLHDNGNHGDELATFECRSTCLYLFELGLEFAEIHASGSWLPLLEGIKLRQGVNKEVRLDRRSCAILLASGFLGVSAQHPIQPEERYPAFDFTEMLNSRYHERLQGVEYCKCLLSYFDSLRQLEHILPCSDGVTFCRKVFLSKDVLPDEAIGWSSELPLIPIEFPESRPGMKTTYRPGNEMSYARIEDFPYSLQVDFANACLGGSVLRGYGSQEESCFITSPECIISLLLSEMLADNEAVEIRNALKYCEFHFEVENRRFRFAGRARDVWAAISGGNFNIVHRRTIVAMDALSFNSYGEHWKGDQYSKKLIQRELVKCYVSFVNANPDLDGIVATGNWGCGCFRGDPQLKLLIQWIAATLAGKSKLIYCAFGEAKVASSQSQNRIATISRMRIGALAKKLMNEHIYMMVHDTFEYVACGDEG